MTNDRLTKRKKSNISYELSDIEKLLLPLVLTSSNPHARTMVYTCIRKYGDYSVPKGDSLKTIVSRYFRSEPIQDYLNMVRVGNMTEEEKAEACIEEEKIDGDVSRDDLISYLTKLQKSSNSDNTKVNIAKVIVGLKGFNKQQTTKAPTKVIYVPNGCHECPLYMKEEEILTKNENKDDND